MNKFLSYTIRTTKIVVSLTALLTFAACSSMPQHGTSPLIGKGSFMFSDWSGPALPVWTYVPPHADSNTRIAFIMHGQKREADVYRDDWVSFARANGFILVAPEFSNEKFPGSRSYNLGGVVDKDGFAKPRDQWAFSAIEPIFDAMKNLTGNQHNRYTIYGHSAGAQFVHRFLYFVPDARVSLAIAANAGWYTMPDFEVSFPYGLRGIPTTGIDLRSALDQSLIVLLGTKDADPNHKSLRRTPEANAQGAHRFARGHTFLDTGEQKARNLNVKFCWRSENVPGVGHNHRRMAMFAAQIMLADPLLCGTAR